MKPSRTRTTPGLWSAPAFPQPVSSFVGRRDELARMLAHAERDVLLVIYGVGGIGKSELGYALVHALRADPRWADAPALLIDVRAGATVARTLAQLAAAVGATRQPPRRSGAGHAAALEWLAQRLDARPALVFLDDVHHLPADELAAALGYLARRLERSRLIVAARRELPLPADAPTPVVTALGPLDAAATAQMAAALAERMAVPCPDLEPVWRATRGSPFEIQRLVRRAPGADAVQATLAELTAPAHRLLRAIAVAAGRLPVAAWRGVATSAALRELEVRFLIDAASGEPTIHDLIREATLARATAAELATAHADAAAACLAELAECEGPRLLVAVDAASHLLTAGRPDDAWAVVEAWYARLAAAGSEHLLLPPLEALRAALPARRIGIELAIARCLVRASSIDAASQLLSEIGEPTRDLDRARLALLAGEVALRRGQTAEAEACFVRAAASADDPSLRFQAQLQAANAAIFAGEGGRARVTLAAAVAELPAPTRRQRGRLAWASTVSLMFDERFEAAAAVARRGRHELGDADADLAHQLAMLETLAAVECEDMASARAAAVLLDEDGLRGQVAALCRAIVRYADSDAATASGVLTAALARLNAAGDAINAYLAGLYGSAALAEVGRLTEAQARAAETTALAERAGLRGPAVRAMAMEALLAAEGLQLARAHQLAAAVLAAPHGGPCSRARAHCAHARAYTIGGDIPLAREHLAHARAAVAEPEFAATIAAIDLEAAAIDLVGGDLDRAVARAEDVGVRYRGRSRDFETARAHLILGAAYVARGRRTDRLLAAQTIAAARSLADAGGLRSLQVGCAVLAAALARHDQRDRAARDVLGDALRQLDPERGSVYAGVLLAAIDGGIAARAAPGAVALLAHLGFTDAVDCYLLDRHGRRAASDRDLARERATRELFVDERDDVIVVRGGAAEIRGRPMLCALLSALAQARGQPVAPDALYRQVWRVAEYHPLHHRNALYVAINRLRASLREVLPEREVIERMRGGWRVTDEVDVCVALAVRAGAPNPQTM
ncbi:MAG: winged helix-turn-helix domain-containing protein [Myxococcales bacterium]|nr:winged helix-turn-helix domain-containing protein [Myxococcales bacterium]MBK7193359.1 winged helix-turn-helix domain-containing protein [Myxococcales bacterium]MBP6848775.1 winged helix-turn-helix domain-containing protein [Kofleriaceae bacterium]